MASSKLRRTPLFGYDGNLGIPIIPPGSSSSTSGSPYQSSNRENSIKSSSGMDVGVSTHRSPYGSSSLDNGTSNGVVSSSRLSSDAPSTPNKHVNFGNNTAVEEKKREKFLTAKYGAHQMALIRKRLKVEMWMYDKLQELFGTDEVEIDLDEVLDMDDDRERQEYIFNLLNKAKAPRENLNVFVGDLLTKVKTL